MEYVGERGGRRSNFRLMLLVCSVSTALTIFLLCRFADDKRSRSPLLRVSPGSMRVSIATDTGVEPGNHHLANVHPLKSEKVSGYSSKTESMRHLQVETLQERLQRVREQCAHIDRPKYDVALHPPESLIVNEEHRIIYCNVPKVGCTSWKSVFLKLGGFDRMNSSAVKRLGPNAQGRTYLDYIHKYTNISHRRFMLQNYTKFMFVRHPFTRILSAFRNKLAPNISFDFRFHDEKLRWVSRYGRQIIEKYRGEEEAKRVSSNYDREYDLTFPEFIRFITDPETDSFNKHWSDIHSMCLPCDIDYDVIGKYETIHDDADYILRLAMVDPSITFPTPTPGSVTNSSDPARIETYYRQISKHLLYKLAELYSTDFELFGYDAESFMNL